MHGGVRRGRAHEGDLPELGDVESADAGARHREQELLAQGLGHGLGEEERARLLDQGEGENRGQVGGNTQFFVDRMPHVLARLRLGLPALELGAPDLRLEARDHGYTALRWGCASSACNTPIAHLKRQRLSWTRRNAPIARAMSPAPIIVNMEFSSWKPELPVRIDK